MAWPQWIATPVGAVWDFVQNVIPVERWVAVVGNVLKYFSLAFVVLAVLFLVVLVNDWGLGSNQRFALELAILILLLVALAIVLILAARSGDLLYSPYERSLRQGKNYGTKERPETKREATKTTTDNLPPQVAAPQIGGPQS